MVWSYGIVCFIVSDSLKKTRPQLENIWCTSGNQIRRRAKKATKDAHLGRQKL